jgi:hypothetical protein
LLPFGDEPEESLDLGAVVILVGAHDQAVPHLHHHAKTPLQNLAAPQVPVHELHLVADGVAVGVELERAVEDVFEILADLSEHGGDLLAPGCYTAEGQRLVRDMQLVDAILSDVAYRLFDVTLWWLAASI